MLNSWIVIFSVCLCAALAKEVNILSEPTIGVQCSHVDRQTYFKIGQKFYFTGGSKVSWFQAAHTCRRFGGELALIESAEELKAISEYLVSKGFDGSDWYWTSGNDLVATHQFQSITSGLALPFTSWSSGQPDFPGQEQCVHLWLREGSFKMNNWKCTERAYYLCQMQDFTRCNFNRI